MSSNMKLREFIRIMIEEELTRLNEMTTTGDVAGYNIPSAFSGNKKKNIRRKTKVAQQLGWKLTKRGRETLSRKADSLTEHTTDN